MCLPLGYIRITVASSSPCRQAADNSQDTTIFSHFSCVCLLQLSEFEGNGKNGWMNDPMFNQLLKALTSWNWNPLLAISAVRSGKFFTFIPQELITPSSLAILIISSLVTCLCIPTVITLTPDFLTGPTLWAISTSGSAGSFFPFENLL